MRLPEGAGSAGPRARAAPDEADPDRREGAAARPAGGRTFVGFGFGPIQAGLYLDEALRCGAFGRLVVGQRRASTARAVAAHGGQFGLNIASSSGIERRTVGPVQVEDVNDPVGRERLVAAVARADEISTALASVDDYASDAPGSVHRLLASGLATRARQGGGPVVIYVSENHPAAARRLAELVLGEVAPPQRAAVRARVCFLDTVIGKMSRTVTDEAEIAERRLLGIAPGERRAFLVESFRSILVSRPRLPDGSVVPRSLTAFEERDDLRPFEDAKLYGHNALHALAAYVGEASGCSFLDELATRPDVMDFLRAAARLEQGVVLRAAHGGQDELFGEAGFAAYAEDLLERMLNPYLRDTTERVGRDPARKLGWDDRLVGVLHRALDLGIGAPRHALGAAAALERLGAGDAWEATLGRLWGRDGSDVERGRVLAAIASGRACLATWRRAGPAGGRPDLEAFVSGWRG